MADIVVTAVNQEPELLAAWSSYVAKHPAATVYHHLAWRTIFGRSFGYRSWMLMARRVSNGEVAGVLPLYLVRGFRSSRLVSVPFRDRGGSLWSDDAALDGLLAAAKGVLQETGASSLVLKALDAWPEAVTGQHGLRVDRHWVRSVASLGGLTESGLWSRIGPKRRNVRQAEAHGLKFADLTASGSGIDCWYALHLQTQKRLGVPPFPRIFFQTMFEELARLDALRLYCVREGGSDCLSAMILLRQPNMGIYGYGASSEAGRQSRANDLMFYSALRIMIEEGRGLFDMGSDSPGQESLLSFKRKWGAVQQRIPVYSLGSPEGAIVDNSSPVYRLARRAFSRIPVAVSALAGRLLTGRFG